MDFRTFVVSHEHSTVVTVKKYLSPTFFHGTTNGYVYVALTKLWFFLTPTNVPQHRHEEAFLQNTRVRKTSFRRLVRPLDLEVVF